MRLTKIITIPNKNRYDFTFVLGGMPIMYPTGGDSVIFKIATMLHERGFKVLLVFIKPKYISHILRETRFNLSTNYRFPKEFRLILYRTMQNYFSSKFLMPIIRKFAKIDYDFSQIKPLDKLFSSSPDKLKSISKYIIATWWVTAFYVNSIVCSGSRKFYFIQNSEDTPEFSGELSPIASLSYTLPLEKIVINSKLEERFKIDVPIRNRIGIDLDFFKITKPITERNDLSILFFFGKAEYKGTKFAIASCNAIHNEYPNAIIKGFGNADPRIIPSFVDFHYKCSNEELRTLYNDSSIFVLPSIVEGFPLTALEAMACGCSLIITSAAGIPEIIEDHKSGMIVPPGDHEAITKAAFELIKSHSLRCSMAASGSEIANKFGYTQMVDDLLNNIISSEKTLI